MSENVDYNDSESVAEELGKRSLPVSEDHDANVETLQTALGGEEDSTEVDDGGTDEENAEEFHNEGDVD